MRILIAPNTFKNSLPATEVAEAIRHGFERSHLKCQCTCFPIGDGGDGTAELIINKQKGFITNVEVRDPYGKKISASFGLIEDGKTAVIEMADASGLKVLQQVILDPLHASSNGTGELMIHALDKNINRIILCIGGSATVDGGSGILQALGIRFLDKEKNELSDLPAALINLDRIDLSVLRKKILDVKIILLCDVESKLLGKKGSAAIFGPQKGATPEMVIKLESRLKKMRDICFAQTGEDMNMVKYGGAAGGTAAGLKILINAIPVSGIEYFLDINAFDEVLGKSDLLITGEGSIDMQTLEGKGPFEVARRAKQINIPVIGFAGKIPALRNPEIMKYFDELIQISNEPDLQKALSLTAENLELTAFQIGNRMAAAGSPL